jgi:large subunit ribosomal protein L21
LRRLKRGGPAARLFRFSAWRAMKAQSAPRVATMYAVIRTGGKQYRVAADEVVIVDRLAGDKGAAVEFGEVLAVGGEDGVKVGAPTVAGARVTASIVEQVKGDTILVFKKRRRQNSRRKNGHRQLMTKVKIESIVA